MTDLEATTPTPRRSNTLAGRGRLGKEPGPGAGSNDLSSVENQKKAIRLQGRGGQGCVSSKQGGDPNKCKFPRGGGRKPLTRSVERNNEAARKRTNLMRNCALHDGSESRRSRQTTPCPEGKLWCLNDRSPEGSRKKRVRYAQHLGTKNSGSKSFLCLGSETGVRKKETRKVGGGRAEKKKPARDQVQHGVGGQSYELVHRPYPDRDRIGYS